MLLQDPFVDNGKFCTFITRQCCGVMRVERVRFGLVRRKEKMVRPERFELPTCCSGGNRSIQLSYGRARMFTVYRG